MFTGLCAFAQSYWDLLVYRTIAGLGLGGEFGIGMALVAEAWPATYRARGCTYVALGWQAGVLVAALLTPLLLPVIGWRGMFLVGLVPGLIAFAVRWFVTEPKIFLERAKARQPKMPLGLLVKDAATSSISLGMLILCSVQNFGYHGLMIWLPSYLSTHFGYTLTQSALWTAVTVLGMAFGMVVFGHFADRFGRRPALFTFQAGAFIMVLVYSQLTTPTTLLIGGAIVGIRKAYTTLRRVARRRRDFRFSGIWLGTASPGRGGAMMMTDLHRPAGRRCGCWPTSTFLFSGICCSQIWGRTVELGIGADADVGFAWSGGAPGIGFEGQSRLYRIMRELAG